MKIAIIYDAGSAEWSAQDVAAVLENIHEVRAALRTRDHEVERAVLVAVDRRVQHHLVIDHADARSPLLNALQQILFEIHEKNLEKNERFCFDAD